jgi:Xaa-Pro aminopeptidase
MTDAGPHEQPTTPGDSATAAGIPGTGAHPDVDAIRSALGPRPVIPAGEYAERRDRARAGAATRNLDGLVAWSMGGSTLDRYANVFWLTNHYEVGNVFPDVAPIFTGFGQSALVLPKDGESILIVNQPDWRDDLVQADRVWVRRNLYDGVLEALDVTGLSDGVVGLTDEERMPVTALRAIETGAPHAAFPRADELLLDLRLVKSAAEIALMRYSSAVSAELVKAMFAEVRPGNTDGDVAAAGAALAARLGAATYDFAMASGPDDGHLWWSRLPSFDWQRPYVTGDIVHPDVYGAVDGYFYDFVRATVVGGRPTDGQKELLEAAVACIHAACAAAVPGALAKDLYLACHAELADRGLAHQPDTDPKASILSADFLESAGHGIGVGWEPPTLTPYDETVLVPGMTLAVEQHVTRAGVGTVRFEETVLVTETGPEIMTAGCPARWW